MKSKKPRASVQLALIMSSIICVVGVMAIIAINWELKRHAIEEAREKARIVLDRNLATHTYFSHQLKPALFKTLDPLVDQDYFEPKWMSSTYAVREIDGYYKEISHGEYYYKEAAINARSPENEADPFEREFLHTLNSSAAISEEADVKTIADKPFFVVMRRGEILEQSCLRCHSTPDAAPEGLVAIYGDTRSFGRRVGETISAISIRIPLAHAYEDSNHIIRELSGVIVLILLTVIVTVFYFSTRIIFNPLNSVREKAIEVAYAPKRLGEQIAIPATREMAELAEAINTMSINLLKEQETLELKVSQRTKELAAANADLSREIQDHKKTISKLEEAVEEVHILSGLLPICAYCKNIRDDKGYWNRIEAYLGEHSKLTFSHGICPDCAARYHADD